MWIQNSLGVILERNGITLSKLFEKYWWDGTGETESTCKSQVWGGAQWDSLWECLRAKMFLVRVDGLEEEPCSLNRKSIRDYTLCQREFEYFGLQSRLMQMRKMAIWNLRVSSNSVNEGLLTVFTVLLAEGERANDEEYIIWKAAEMEKHKSKGYFIMAVNLCF